MRLIVNKTKINFEHICKHWQKVYIENKSGKNNDPCSIGNVVKKSEILSSKNDGEINQNVKNIAFVQQTSMRKTAYRVKI